MSGGFSSIYLQRGYKRRNEGSGSRYIRYIPKPEGELKMLEKLIVCIVAGLGAGIGTGFAGMSAAAVISPMLITFLGFSR